MLDTYPVPEPAPLESFAPTNVNNLAACPLRVAFSRDQELREWRRPSLPAALGRVAHAVTEFAFSPHRWPSEPFDVKSALNDEWDRHVARESSKLAEAWTPAEPPPARDWPNYQLTRVRTLRRSEKEISSAREQPHVQNRPVEPDDRAFVVSEARLSDSQSGLYGWADRIQRTSDGFRVIDLKTGVNQAEASEDQERQLLLYGVLCHRKYGEWPDEIVIENASGEQYSRALDPDKAEAALAEACALVNEFNESVAEPAEFLSRASPSAEVCRWCEFRVVCRPYGDTSSVDWDHRVVGGEIVGVSETAIGLSVTVAPTVPAGLSNQVTISKVLAPIPPSARYIVADGVRGALDSADVAAVWSTRIRVW